MTATIAPQRPPLPVLPGQDASPADWDAYRKTKAMRDAAEKFETTFVSQMFEHMWSGVKSSSPFGGGHAEETWRSMLTEQYAKAVTKRGGVGIADMVYSQMLRMQEERT